MWTMRSIVIAIIALAASATHAEKPANAVHRPLGASIEASWTRVPIRDWADRVGGLAGRPVIVDRRLDPDQLVTLTARGESVGEVLTRVAASIGASVDPLESSIRLVPAGAAGLASQAERDTTVRMRRHPARARAALAEQQPWRWPAGARPRELVAAAAAEAGVTVTGLDQVPHDHFPAADLPPLSLTERLDLVLAHFDQRVVWSIERGQPRGRIVPIAAEIQPTDDDGQRGPPPDRGTGSRPRPKNEGREPRRRPGERVVFSLRLEAPLDQAIAAIAKQLGLEPFIDEASLKARGIAVGEIVRADVTDASRDELLDAMLGPLGLRWTIEAGRLVVDAAVVAPADVAAAVASRASLPSVHGDRGAVRTALLAAELAPAAIDGLFDAADRANLPGMVPSLDGFLFLTRDPAWRRLRQHFAEFLELPEVTSLEPDLVASLEGYSGVISLPGISSLSEDSATALAGFGADDWAAAVEFPGVTDLDPAAAAAVARCPALLVFPNLERLSAASARGLARHQGIGIVLGGLRALPADVAAALAKTTSMQGLMLPDLEVLDSQPLARRLARQDHAFLPAVTALSPEVATALRGNDGGELALPGLASLPPTVATQLVGGGYFWLVFGSGGTLTPDVATILVAHPGQLTFTGPAPLPVDAAAALAPHTGTLRLPHLDRLSPELAAVLGRHTGPLVLDGIVRLDGPDAMAITRSLIATPGLLALPALERIAAPALEILLEKQDIQLPPLDALDIVGAGGLHQDVIRPPR